MGGGSQKVFVVGGIITILLFVGGVFLLARGEKAVSTDEKISILGDYDESKAKGTQDRNVEIIEFSDFQCPACAETQPVLSQIMNVYGDHVLLVYRHFPLRSIHPHAQLAAEASEAAAAQGKFWEMHDMLFERQSEWSELDSAVLILRLATYAQEIGIDDVPTFQSAIENRLYSDIVDDDYRAASALNLTGTPTLFVNGERLDNRSFEAISSKIESILSENE